VDRALAWQPEHLSLYALTVEPGTALAAQIERGQVEDVDDDRAAEMYEWAEERLHESGYLHYEISNWARPGCESRHNLIYWRNQPYLGLGAGAHSWYGGQRWANAGDPAEYIARLRDAPSPSSLCLRPQAGGGLRGGGPAAVEAQQINARTELSETMMMGLRLLREGVSVARFRQRFGVSMDEVYPDEIQAAVAEGLLEQTAHCLRLTDRGHLLGNRVFVRFV
jgi:oxygen-independent coproporphyrinogen-3 oxidase